MVEADPKAPSRPQVLMLRPGCQQESCYHVLLADDTKVEYLDLGIRIKMVLGVSSGKAGLVFSAKDNKNFYAVVVTPETNTLQSLLGPGWSSEALWEKKKFCPWRGNGIFYESIEFLTLVISPLNVILITN